MKNRCTRLQAFTLIELLVVIAILAILVAIQIPARAATKASVARVYCSSNLKRVGIAFRTWAGNHNDRMPMATSYVQGGAYETVGVRASGATFSANMNPPKGVFGMFVVMSNELTTPKILYCPSEYRANIQQGSVFGNTVGTNVGFYSDNGTSYFVGVDANTVNPNMLLTGDHNLGDGTTPPTTASIYGESSRWFVALGTNSTWGSQSPGWADNQHQKQGNVTFADGSVQNLTTARLREALNKTGDPGRSAGSFVQATGSLGTGVNRLQFP